MELKLCLKAEASVIMKLALDLCCQNKCGTVEFQHLEIDMDKVYTIMVADTIDRLVTYTGRIISYTLSTSREVLSYVSKDSKPDTVDTITIDCSSEGMSEKHCINVCDIRGIEETTVGMEEVYTKDIPDFK